MSKARFEVGDIIRMKSIEEIFELERAGLVARSLSFNTFCGCVGEVLRVESDNSIHVRMVKPADTGGELSKVIQGIKCIRFALEKSFRVKRQEKVAEAYDALAKYISNYGAEFKLPDESHCSREVIIDLMHKIIYP